MRGLLPVAPQLRATRQPTRQHLARSRPALYRPPCAPFANERRFGLPQPAAHPSMAYVPCDNYTGILILMAAEMDRRDPARALRLLRSEPLPPLPSPKDLLDAESPRRPGELHEALALPHYTAKDLVERAARSGLTVDVAASLALEAGHLRMRLPQLQQLRPCGGEISTALPEASARYLRSLTMGRRRHSAPARVPSTVAIPIRLIPRLGATDIEELIDLVPLEQAIAWEIAAVSTGQTMSEWALGLLLLEV